MSNRIIKIDVAGEIIKASSKTIGAAGSHNAVTLEISFDSAWDGTTKKLYFFDALGGNPIYRLLTLDLLKDGETDVWLVPVPSEPLASAGEATLTIRGVELNAEDDTVADRIMMAASTTFTVLEALVPSSDVEPAEPTATQAEQLQAEIDAIAIDITTAQQAVIDASGYAVSAGSSATAAAVSATSASGSAVAAAASAVAAGTAQGASEDAQNAAESAKTTAQSAQAASEAAKSSAETAATNAASSAASASESATTATTKAGEAAVSSASASGSASTAITKSGEASASASAAAESASSALDSAAAAYASESNASNSAAAAAASALEAAAIAGGDYLTKSGDGSSVIAAFTEAAALENIVSGTTLATLFGKIKKVFSSLGTAAFQATTAFDAAGTVSTHNAATDAHNTRFAAKLSLTGGTMTGAINEALVASMALASTMAIGAAAGNYIIVTAGTGPIVSFDAVAMGARRFLRFAVATTITYNATSMLLPGASDLPVAAGDVLEFVSGGAGTWRCVNIQPWGAWPVELGGTGANTASGARTNLDVYSKTEALSGSTAALYGDEDATPDEVFQAIKTKSFKKIGEIFPSVRTDYAGKALLCNGAGISKETYTELGALLPYDTVRNKTVGTSSGTMRIKYVNGYYILLKQYGGSDTTGYIYYTTDPTGTWNVTTITTHGSGTACGAITDISYGNGYWVITESENSGTQDAWVYCSTSLTGTWTAYRVSTAYMGLYQIEFLNGYFIAQGISSGTTYYYASDPTGTWTYLSLSGTYIYAGCFRLVNGQFVIALSNSAGTTTVIYAGSTPLSMPLATTIYDVIYDISYANGYYFAYHNTSGVTKYGSSLSTMTTPTGLKLRPVTFLNGRYFALDTSSRLYYSTNLTSWTILTGTMYANVDFTVYNAVLFGVQYSSSSYVLYYHDSSAAQLPTLTADDCYYYIQALED